MSYFEFPHTRTYDSDLGWLIKSMKELIDEYNDILSTVSTNTSDITALKKRITALEGSWSTLQKQFDTYKEQMNSYIYQVILSYMNDMYDRINSINVLVENLSTELVREKASLVGLIQATDELNRNWTNIRIQEIIDSFPELVTVYVYNPIKGMITDINEAVIDLYDLSRTGGLTASQYDLSGLTANENDSLGLTAYEYDNYGLEYIWKNPAHYMYDPFSGSYQTLQYVITELIDLHRSDALTANEYDVLALDASYYDNLEITAYNYDFNGHTYVQ